MAGGFGCRAADRPSIAFALSVFRAFFDIGNSLFLPSNSDNRHAIECGISPPIAATLKTVIGRPRRALVTPLFDLGTQNKLTKPISGEAAEHSR